MVLYSQQQPMELFILSLSYIGETMNQKIKAKLIAISDAKSAAREKNSIDGTRQIQYTKYMREPKIMKMDWRPLGYWPVYKDGKLTWEKEPEND